MGFHYKNNKIVKNKNPIEYDKLPIYKDIYDVNVNFTQFIRNTPREFRFHVEDATVSFIGLSELCYRIAVSNDKGYKKEALEILVENVSTVIFKTRLLGEPRIKVLSIMAMNNNHCVDFNFLKVYK